MQAAQQAGLLRGPSGLKDFLISTLENVGALMLPFVYAGYQVRTRSKSRVKQRINSSISAEPQNLALLLVLSCHVLALENGVTFGDTITTCQAFGRQSINA